MVLPGKALDCLTTKYTSRVIRKYDILLLHGCGGESCYWFLVKGSGSSVNLWCRMSGVIYVVLVYACCPDGGGGHGREYVFQPNNADRSLPCLNSY
jgi:hypothetical protein